MGDGEGTSENGRGGTEKEVKRCQPHNLTHSTVWPRVSRGEKKLQ